MSTHFFDRLSGSFPQNPRKGSWCLDKYGQAKTGVSATFASNIGHIGILLTSYAPFHTGEEIGCQGGFWGT